MIVYLDRVRHNVARVIDALGGDPDRWRPHLKTTKLPAVFELLVRAGVRSFKCATTREAACVLHVLETMRVEGDVLLAHPQRGPNLERLAGLAAEHPRASVSVLCEDPDAVAGIPEHVGVFLDLDVGMHRTGVDTARVDECVALARRCGDRFRGVHAYEGHLTGGDAGQRRARAFACYEMVTGLLDDLERAGIAVGEIVTSGTPTFPFAVEFEPFRAHSAVHRVSPGTVVLHDMRTEHERGIDDLGLVPAALVFTRVVSRPRDGVVTCDAGSKSIAAEVGDPSAGVLDHPGLVAQKPSEEHLPLHVTAGEGPARGTELYLAPVHVCPTVNLAEQVVLMDSGVVVDTPYVAARAHELLL